MNASRMILPTGMLICALLSLAAGAWSAQGTGGCSFVGERGKASGHWQVVRGGETDAAESVNDSTPWASSLYGACVAAYPQGYGFEAGWHIGKVISIGVGYYTSDSWSVSQEAGKTALVLRAHLPFRILPVTPYASIESSHRGDESSFAIGLGAMYSATNHLHFRAQLGMLQAEREVPSRSFSTSIFSDNSTQEAAGSYPAVRISAEFTFF